MSVALFNLREELLKEASKKQCVKIVQWVGNSQERFNELFQLFLSTESRVVQRAAWPASYCVEAYPELIKPHFGQLFKKLSEENMVTGIKRNSMRLLQYVKVPKKYHGSLMDICFKYLASPTETVAVKVFSLYVLAILAKTYPDIWPEIKILIEDQLPHQTPAFKSSAKKILKTK